MKKLLLLLILSLFNCNDKTTQPAAEEKRGKCRINCQIEINGKSTYTESFIYNVTEKECKDAAKEEAENIKYPNSGGCTGNMVK